VYNIVIADDDEIQLQGMCCAFPWDQLDIRVVAGVDDGDKALLAAKEYKADILLTDIKMSNLDGLSLTERIRKECGGVHVVLMSAYDDFRYAQRALRLGVDDYLLKPIDLDQLRETMKQIVHQKNEKKRREESERQNKRLQDMASEDEGILEETFFQNVLNQKYSIETCRKLEAPYRSSRHQEWVVMEAIFDDKRDQDEKLQMIKKVSQERNYQCIHSFGNNLICCHGEKDKLMEDIHKLREECRARIKTVDPQATISFIIGPTVSELYYLGLSCEKIFQIRDFQFIEGKNVNLTEKDLDKYFNQRHTINKTLIEYLAKLVMIGNTDMLPAYIDKLKTNLKCAGSESIVMFSFSLSSILGELHRVQVLEKTINEQFDELYCRILKQTTLDEAMALLETELIKLARQARPQKSISAEQSIQKACDYIERNFCNSRLRMKDVAVEVGLSQNYFSTVFTEVTGESFTDYLIKRRMKEAQLLLLNSDDKIQEIGYQIGYENPAYFSATFKKFVGVSISKYKEMIKAPE